MNTPSPALPADNGELLHLPLDRISVQPGFNTRTYFDEKSIDELAESIRAAGCVIQPIAVRPDPGQDGHYRIIAGERRWLAARKAALVAIPAVVRDVSDREALLINALENKDRENLSAAEEAVLVRRMVDAMEGDRDEAARQLGFSRKIVDARLLLLNATPEVREALAARRIKIGHAELLAVLPQDKQGKGLASVIEKSMTVEELRRHVDLYALNLKSAIFDTTGCRECSSNTSLQSSLFEVHVGEGRCTNRECFEEKRTAAVQLRLAELKQSYPVVWSDQDKDPATYTLLCKQGQYGVGNDQFQACLGCANYGVLMSTAPGQEGQVTKDMCFDLDCHRTKVKEYQESLRPSETSTPSTGATPPASSARTTGKPKSKAKAKAVPRRIEDLVHRFWRDTASQIILERQDLIDAFAVYALTQLAGSDGRDKPLRAAGLKSADFRADMAAKALEQLFQLAPEKRSELRASLTAGYLRDHLENGYGKEIPLIVDVARRTLKHAETALDAHFQISREFIGAHTKSGIESLMHEAGFDKWYNANHKDDKAFGKLMTEKHDAIVKTILSSGFDFKGFVPKSARV